MERNLLDEISKNKLIITVNAWRRKFNLEEIEFDKTKWIDKSMDITENIELTYRFGCVLTPSEIRLLEKEDFLKDLIPTLRRRWLNV